MIRSPNPAPRTRLKLGLIAALACAAMPVAAMADAPPIADPAVATIDLLDNGLIGILHAGARAGYDARARMIAPVIARAFDVALMTRLSVGPGWSAMSAHDQAALVNAFRAVTVASYAHNFDGFSGQHFIVSPQVETRGGDKLVRTMLATPGSESEALNYRLRESDGQWRIIDVYYRNAISQLATRRSDFAAVLAKGGAPALVAHLNQLAANPK